MKKLSRLSRILENSGKFDAAKYSSLKEETFAVSRFLAKSAKVYSREIFQKTSSVKVSKKVIICKYSEKNSPYVVIISNYCGIRKISKH